MRWEDIGVKMRGYQSPISIRNVANDIDDKIRCCWMFAVKIKTCFTVISSQRQKILALKTPKIRCFFATQTFYFFQPCNLHSRIVAFLKT